MPQHPDILRLRALRLALRLMAGTLTASTFGWEHRPFADPAAAAQWVRTQLIPLARSDRTLREVLRVLDEEGGPPPWDAPRAARRELRRLGAQARDLGTCLRTRPVLRPRERGTP